MPGPVLVLSASYGEGHRRAALAVKAAIERMRPAMAVEVIDFFEFVNPTLNSVTRFSYIQSVKRLPSLYGRFYQSTGNISPDSWLQRKVLNRLGRERLLEYIASHRPVAVVSTFPTPAGVLSDLKAEGLVDIPSFTVITDYVIHSQWIHPRVDGYFVGSEDVAGGLRERGISSDRVLVSGIPIDPRFGDPKDLSGIRERLGVDESLPTVLVMGGAFGMLGGVRGITRLLHEARRPLQSLVVCGRDKRLRQMVERVAAGDPRIKVFGFVQEVDQLMAVSDLLITKAGGLTVTEALSAHLPMLVYRPIPGQERHNTSFLVRQGAAVSAEDLGELGQAVEELLGNRKRLLAMRRAAARLSRPGAAREVAEGVLQSLAKTVGDSV